MSIFDFNDFPSDYAQAFADHSRLAHQHINKAENALANFIHEVQNGTDEETYIKFHDNVGYPCFVNTTIDTYENIYGVKAVGENEEDRQILIYTDDNPYDEMGSNEDGWFYWRDYGDLELDDLYYYIVEAMKCPRP